MDRIRLFEKYRLVERSESEINGAWKGVHLLLFFMAFVFGSFCTFCFHMLMYLFDEKCVLNPKLQSLTALKHNVIFEFIPPDKEAAKVLPLDFLSTQWVEKSACYLPTYVPLISGICGLIWTTMFLMCSTGSRTLTGLQRSWRVLPPVFLFSLAMSGLCIYSSVITHFGLQELCLKLGEITGSPTCTYTVNVATLAYERRIRGVYQATKLTIFSAWLHTSCWLLSALLTLARVLLVVDFQLVRINVDLVGNVEKLLEGRELQLCTVFPDVWFNTDDDSTKSYPMYVSDTPAAELVNKSLGTEDDDADKRKNLHAEYDDDNDNLEHRYLGYVPSDILLFSQSSVTTTKSEHSLVPEEKYKLEKIKAYKSVALEHQFVVKILLDMLESIEFPEYTSSILSLSSNDSEKTILVRQYGQERIMSPSEHSLHLSSSQESRLSVTETQELTEDIKSNLQGELSKKVIALSLKPKWSMSMPSTSKGNKEEDTVHFESIFNITEEMQKTIKQNLRLKSNSPSPGTTKLIKKSNLKNIGIQTNEPNKALKGEEVEIANSTKKHTSSEESGESTKDENKETDTPKKEKQD